MIAWGPSTASIAPPREEGVQIESRDRVLPSARGHDLFYVSEIYIVNNFFSTTLFAARYKNKWYQTTSVKQLALNKLTCYTVLPAGFAAVWPVTRVAYGTVAASTCAAILHTVAVDERHLRQGRR
jgi:hypothetical protein